jgi:PAS domain S-box-containing protein
MHEQLAQRVNGGRPEESLRLLSSAVEHAKEAIMITDAELDWPGPKIIFVNPAYSRMTGYTAEESLGKTPRILQGPRTDKTVLRRLRHNLAQGEMFEGEVINYRKDGTEYDLEWQIAPIRDAGGKITHFVAIQRDVTQRKQATRELETAVRQLFQANAAKDRILAVTTHDLRGPLSAVRGMAEFLRDGTLGPVTQKQAETLTYLIEGVESMLTLVNDLLDVTTLDDQSLKLERRPLDLAPILRWASVIYAQIAAQKKLHLELAAPESGLEVAGDEIRLKRVLENLVMNAIKFSPPNTRIGIGGRGEGDSITVWVDDEGPGVPVDEQAKLFTDYGRTSTRPSGGESSTGLGLAICRRIVSAHGGVVSMRNRAGGGAHFEFSLPRITQPAEMEA